jgi:hypothetical protein
MTFAAVAAGLVVCASRDGPFCEGISAAPRAPIAPWLLAPPATELHGWLGSGAALGGGVSPFPASRPRSRAGVRGELAELVSALMSANAAAAATADGQCVRACGIQGGGGGVL